MGRAMVLLEVACFHCISAVDVCFSFFLRIIGPMLVVAANGLILLVTHQYLFVVVPRFLTPQLGMVSTCAVVLFGLFLLSNILFNYWACVLTRPGFPGHHLDAIAALDERGDSGERRRFCKKCRVPKPARTHHCSVCNRCVMKMDHHCPWVNNCVGFYNYRYFLLFLIYLAAGCAFVAVSCFKPVFSGGRLHQPHDTFLLFVFVLSLSVLFALSLFVFWHAYLVASNQTTIEFYCNRFDASEARKEGRDWCNPYNIGIRANYEQVFGMSRHVGSWLLPSTHAPPGDGVDFPSKSNDAMHEV